MNIFIIPFFIYEILLCIIFSVFFIKKGLLRDKALFLFLIFLFIVEYYCALLKKDDLPTNHIYNFWFPIEYFFYSLFIGNYLINKFTKKIAYILSFSNLIFVVIFYSLQSSLKEFSSLAYLTGFTTLLIIMLFKLYEILNQEIIYNPLKNEIFWFIMGLLFVNLGGFFHFGAVNYLNKNNNELHKALQSLNVYLTEFQYLCFTLYFLCKWKYPK